MASPVGFPTTSGTGTRRPRLTEISTVEPSSASVPARGFCSETVCGSLQLSKVDGRTSNPASSRIPVASSCVSPITVGTVTCCERVSAKTTTAAISAATTPSAISFRRRFFFASSSSASGSVGASSPCASAAPASAPAPAAAA